MRDRDCVLANAFENFDYGEGRHADYYCYICCMTLGHLINLSVYGSLQKENNRMHS